MFAQSPTSRILLVCDSLPFAYRIVGDPSLPPASASTSSSWDSLDSLENYSSAPRAASSAASPSLATNLGGASMAAKSRRGVRPRSTTSASPSVAAAMHPSAHHAMAAIEELVAVPQENHIAYRIGSIIDRDILHVGKAHLVDARGIESVLSCDADDEDYRLYLAQCYASEVKPCLPVFIEPKVADGHWQGFCCKTLWPQLHYLLGQCELDAASQSQQWSDYVRVNELFCDAIIAAWRPGDIVWIMDYQLMLLPAMLRAKCPLIFVALYVRPPFPSSEVFRCLPQAREILAGMIGANIVGFQTSHYARHFISCCTRILGCETTPKSVDNSGLPVQVVSHPVGIDIDAIRRAIQREGVQQKVAFFREKYAGKRIILGLESIDQSKGILHKLAAMQRLLSDYPEWQGMITLLQVVFPGPHIGQRLEVKVTEVAAKLNGNYGSLAYEPVQIYYQPIEEDEYLALLTLADVLLITSERDSVNTMVLDYIASQEASMGIPILSEFIGLANLLSPSFQVNPYDHAGVASIINEALLMTSEDRRTYYASISRFVWANTLRHWVGSFVKATQNSLLLLDAYLPTPPLLIDGVIDAFADAATRLILLDYDGTLSPICKTPSAAVPSQGVLRALRLLTADPKNRVYIISGRDQATLEGWLGAIPRLGLSAEHGSFLRLITEPGETSNWTPMVNMEELTWKDAVMTILDYYTERTVGSLIEEKAASITWHYRLADPDFGSWQAKELQSHLESTIASAFPVEVVIGKKNIEVRPKSSNKGEIVRALIERHGRAKFILCAGDDKTDEDMFRVFITDRCNGTIDERSPLLLQPLIADDDDEGRSSSEEGGGGGPANCFTCSIGGSSKKTLARYHLNSCNQLVSLLMRLSQLTTDRVVGATM